MGHARSHNCIYKIKDSVFPVTIEGGRLQNIQEEKRLYEQHVTQLKTQERWVFIQSQLWFFFQVTITPAVTSFVYNCLKICEFVSFLEDLCRIT